MTGLEIAIVLGVLGFGARAALKPRDEADAAAETLKEVKDATAPAPVDGQPEAPAASPNTGAGAPSSDPPAVSANGEIVPASPEWYGQFRQEVDPPQTDEERAYIAEANKMAVDDADAAFAAGIPVAT